MTESARSVPTSTPTPTFCAAPETTLARHATTPAYMPWRIVAQCAGSTHRQIELVASAAPLTATKSRSNARADASARVVAARSPLARLASYLERAREMIRFSSIRERRRGARASPPYSARADAISALSRAAASRASTIVGSWRLSSA